MSSDETTAIDVQGQPRFIKQLDTGRTKFYELMHSDPRFPKRFKLGGKWVYYIKDCNEYVKQCAETPPEIVTSRRRNGHASPLSVQMF